MNSNRKSYSWQRVNCSYEKGLYMRIERVESLDKRKCKVFTDEDFAFLLYNGELEKYGVCEGAVLEERTERELLDLLSRRAHERALNLWRLRGRGRCPCGDLFFVFTAAPICTLFAIQKRKFPAF